MIFITNGYISKVSTTQDKSCKLAIETQELSAEAKTRLFELSDQFVVLAIKPHEESISEEDMNVPEIKTERGEKTPSERLRAVLFVYWEQNGKGKEDFDVFYRRQMNKIIDKVKGELE